MCIFRRLFRQARRAGTNMFVGSFAKMTAKRPIKASHYCKGSLALIGPWRPETVILSGGKLRREGYSMARLHSRQTGDNRRLCCFVPSLVDIPTFIFTVALLFSFRHSNRRLEAKASCHQSVFKLRERRRQRSLIHTASTGNAHLNYLPRDAVQLGQYHVMVNSLFRVRTPWDCLASAACDDFAGTHILCPGTELVTYFSGSTAVV